MIRWFMAGILFVLLLLGIYLIWDPGPAQARPLLDPTPTPSPTPGITPTLITMQPLPTRPFPKSTQPVEVVKGISLGLTGAIECYNCTPFSAKVHLSHYEPNEGPQNCWDYDEKMQYCYSPTKMDVPWKSIYGIGAACPKEWPYGSWVEIPEVGAFICFDRGGSIVCDPHTKICNVDILGPGGPWDQKEYDVTLWVPLDPPREGK